MGGYFYEEALRPKEEVGFFAELVTCLPPSTFSPCLPDFREKLRVPLPSRGLCSGTYLPIT